MKSEYNDICPRYMPLLTFFNILTFVFNRNVYANLNESLKVEKTPL